MLHEALLYLIEILLIQIFIPLSKVKKMQRKDTFDIYEKSFDLVFEM